MCPGIFCRDPYILMLNLSIEISRRVNTKYGWNMKSIDRKIDAYPIQSSNVIAGGGRKCCYMCDYSLFVKKYTKNL